VRKLFIRSAIPLALLVTVGTATLVATSVASGASSTRHDSHVVTIPEADKFTPYHMTIRAGDSVTWVNNDTDDHTVVSDDAFNSAGHRGIDHLILGTTANHGKPGTFTVRFRSAGTFVYYCRFHAHLDGDKQPVAPGPNGGIQDAKGNFGTPMSGVITVVSSHDDD
jgi:plastocyanin